MYNHTTSASLSIATFGARGGAKNDSTAAHKHLRTPRTSLNRATLGPKGRKFEIQGVETEGRRWMQLACCDVSWLRTSRILAITAQYHNLSIYFTPAINRCQYQPLSVQHRDPTTTVLPTCPLNAPHQAPLNYTDIDSIAHDADSSASTGKLPNGGAPYGLEIPILVNFHHISKIGILMCTATRTYLTPWKLIAASDNIKKHRLIPVGASETPAALFISTRFRFKSTRWP